MPRPRVVALLVVLVSSLLALLAFAWNGAPGDDVAAATSTTTTTSSSTTLPTGTDPCHQGDRYRAGGLNQEARRAYREKLEESAQNSAAYSCAVEGLNALAPTTTTEAKRPSLVKAAREAIGKEVQWPFLQRFGRLQLDIWDWILLTVLIGFIIRTSARLRDHSRPGYVEITEMSGSGKTAEDEDVDLDALSASFREHLARSRLFGPALLPGGELQSALEDVIQKNPLTKDVGAKAIDFLQGILWPRHGHVVKPTLRTRTGAEPWGITIELASAIDGKAKGVWTEWATFPDDACEEAAERVAASILSEPRVRQTADPWARWSPDGRGLRNYSRGNRLLEEGDVSGALSEFQAARAVEPSNGLILLALGNAHELNNDFLGAIYTYTAAVGRWPTFWSARYRLATALSFYEQWWPSWLALSAEDKATLAQLIARGIDVPVVTGAIDAPAMLDAAIAHYKVIEDELSLPWKRGVAVQLDIVRSAKLCTRVQKSPSTTALDAEAENLAPMNPSLGQRSAAPSVRYNVACFWARRSTGASDVGTATRRAVEQLRLALHDERGGLDAGAVAWLFDKDPDLAPVRSSQEFRRLALEVRGPEEAPADEPTEVLRAWTTVVTGAAAVAAAWSARSSVTLPKEDAASTQKVAQWVSAEVHLRQALRELAAEAGSGTGLPNQIAKRRSAFWKVVQHTTGESEPTKYLLDANVDDVRAAFATLLSDLDAQLPLWEQRLNSLSTRLSTANWDASTSTWAIQAEREWNTIPDVEAAAL